MDAISTVVAHISMVINSQGVPYSGTGGTVWSTTSDDLSMTSVTFGGSTGFLRVKLRVEASVCIASQVRNTLKATVPDMSSLTPRLTKENFNVLVSPGDIVTVTLCGLMLA